MGIKVGLAGYGLAGSVFHAPLIEAVEGLDPTGLLTRTGKGAGFFRKFASISELLAAVDLLVVATPNSSHAELAIAALEAGKHVVIDKPMAVTAADARRVVDAGPDRVTVFHNRRWDGDFLTLRALVRDGTLGPVTRFESRFERFRPAIKQGWRELGDAAEGGGVLLDLGPHLIDQAVALFGPPESVYAEVRTRRPGAAVDDDAFVALQHAGGEVSHLWMSAIAPLHGPRFRVSGMAAGFGCDGLDPQEAQLRDGMRPGAEGLGEDAGRTGWIAAGGAGVAAGAAGDAGDGAGDARVGAGVAAGDAGDGAGDAASGGGDAPRSIPLERGQYVRFYEGVVAWIRDGAPPPVDPLDAVRVMEILEKWR